MLQATPQLRTALVFAAIVVLTAESIALFLLVRVLENIILKWNRR
jgi:putative hydroxymethylpyrimidine transport system permease protein